MRSINKPRLHIIIQNIVILIRGFDWLKLLTRNPLKSYKGCWKYDNR